MSELRIRLKYIFLPYLFISTVFIALYTFLHWLLVIRLGWFAPVESIINIGLPVTICWVPVLIWLVPRFKLFRYRFSGERGNPALFLFMFAAFTPCWPNYKAQEYITAATDNLTLIKSVNQINSKTPTKYYKIDDLYIDKHHASVFNKIFVSGQHHETINTGIYFTCPVYSKATITDSLIKQATPMAWLGVKYEGTISNNLLQSEKDIAIERFTIDANAQFKAKDFDDIAYLERIDHSGLYQAYLAAVNNNVDKRLTKAIIFEVREESVAAKHQNDENKLIWFFISLFTTNIAWLLLILLPDLGETRIK